MQADLWSCGLVLWSLGRGGAGKEENPLEVLTSNKAAVEQRSLASSPVICTELGHSRAFVE